MRNLAKSRNFWIVASVDLGLLTLAYLLSFMIRFDSFDLSAIPDAFLIPQILPFVLACKLIVFYVSGLYRGVWRYTGIRDLFNIIKATVLSSCLIVVILFYLLPILRVPRSVLAIDALLTLVLIAGFRLFIRLYLSPSFCYFKGKGFLSFYNPTPQVNLLIIGAGDAGEKILREISDNPRLCYHIVGFVDDDPRKKGRWIHGLPVFGKIEDLPQIIQQRRIQELLIAIPSATGKQMLRIVSLCQNTGVRFKTVPGLGDLIDGRVSVKEIRDVSFEDLLGRAPVRLDESGIYASLAGKRVLVTGAGGSIGSELCRQIARFSPELLICFERAENSLFHLETRILRETPDLFYRSYIGDVLDKSRLCEVFSQTSPQLVFHAAAYKHVPLMELNPVEAIKNNILGTQNIACMADHWGVEQFVLISTDKAVNPASVMGATKRAAELIIQCLPRDGSGKFITVRFGNVVGSEGSVVPFFQAQIAKGGPVTVTHPEATRFFMSIPEAVQLILEAGSLAQGGEIFLLDMGEPMRIVEMAEHLIQLSGKEPYSEVDIVFTGLRPGEKLHEKLMTSEEDLLPTPVPKIWILKPSSIDRSETFQKIESLNQLILSANGNPITIQSLFPYLREILPEYNPQAEPSVGRDGFS